MPHLSQECHYDPLGNLTFATPNSYNYDELSQLGGEFDSHYDLPDVPATGNLRAANGLPLTYDEHDRLIQAGLIHFTYDALGRRLSKGDELYLYDGLEEIGTTTTLKIANVLLDLHGTLAIPLFDATHTLRYLVDPKTHTIINSYEFDPFGIPIYIFESIENPYRYAFKHHDKETNLIYFGKRYYNPTTNRWATPDPLGPIDVVNLYTFVRNNPFRFTDFTGLYSVLFNTNLNHLNDQFRFNLNPPEPLTSSLYEVGTKKLTFAEIYFVNGINTSLKDAKQHAQMLSNLGGGVLVRGIHNQTDSAPIDSLECLLASKIMPTNVSFLILREMQRFHKTAPPDAKMFLGSHSGGSIQVRNALMMASPEVRNRVISLAIAPGAIIPNELCYLSFNYATKWDFVVWHAIFNDPFHAHEITFLDSHPSAPKFDHAFNSPTFTKKISNHINQFIDQSGDFK